VPSPSMSTTGGAWTNTEAPPNICMGVPPVLRSSSSTCCARTQPSSLTCAKCRSYSLTGGTRRSHPTLTSTTQQTRRNSEGGAEAGAEAAFAPMAAGAATNSSASRSVSELRRVAPVVVVRQEERRVRVANQEGSVAKHRARRAHPGPAPGGRTIPAGW
jgi:hypothetical protein